jgi:DNA invertase Pin-like site-specific DNA recombinase
MSAVEELYGRLMLERARREGHKPKLPEFTGREIVYEPRERGKAITESVEQRYRSVSHMTPEEVAAHLGVTLATVQRAGRQYKIAFGS